MKKILIVDDQDTIRSIIKENLQEIENTVIVEAANGNQALGKAKVIDPALILLDIVMPNKDGFETIKELKENPVTKNIPIIVISSHAEKENVDKAIKLGAEKLIDKNELNNINLAELVKNYL